MADLKYMEKTTYDISLGADVYRVYVSLGANESMPSITLLPSAEPATPAEGMIYYDSTENKLMVYTGSAWETITSA